MNKIRGLQDLYEYFRFVLSSGRPYLDPKNDPSKRPSPYIVFLYGGNNRYIINGDTTAAGMKRFVELYELHKDKIEGNGDVCDKILMPELTGSTESLKLAHDDEHQYFYCYKAA